MACLMETVLPFALSYRKFVVSAVLVTRSRLESVLHAAGCIVQLKHKIYGLHISKVRHLLFAHGGDA